MDGVLRVTVKNPLPADDTSHHINLRALQVLEKPTAVH